LADSGLRRKVAARIKEPALMRASTLTRTASPIGAHTAHRERQRRQQHPDRRRGAAILVEMLASRTVSRELAYVKQGRAASHGTPAPRPEPRQPVQRRA